MRSNVNQDTPHVYFGRVSCATLQICTLRCHTCLGWHLSRYRLVCKGLLQLIALIDVDELASSRIYLLFFFSPTCLSSMHHSAPLGQQLILEARSNHCQCLRVRTLCAVVLPTPFHCALQVADCERVTWKILFKKIPSLSFPYGSVFLLRVAKQETFFSATHYDVAECIFPSCAAKCLASPQILSAWICCMSPHYVYLCWNASAFSGSLPFIHGRSSAGFLLFEASVCSF